MAAVFKLIRIALVVALMPLVAWMAVFSMPFSALWGAALAWFLWPRARRTWKTGWMGLTLALLLPVFALQVTLPEFARSSDRASCAVRYAMGRPGDFCQGVSFRKLSADDTGPVLTLGQRIGVAGFKAMTQGSANRRECGLEGTVHFRGATKRPGAPIGRGGGGASAMRGRASPPRQQREAVVIVQAEWPKRGP